MWEIYRSLQKKNNKVADIAFLRSGQHVTFFRAYVFASPITSVGEGWKKYVTPILYVFVFFILFIYFLFVVVHLLEWKGLVFFMFM